MSAHEGSRQLDAVFLRDVVANPRDDAALLIYSDWLQDQPDESSRTRGEYLRVAWFAERAKSRRERHDLHWQAQSLWWTHVVSWLGPLYAAVDHFIYDRGRLIVEISEKTFLPSTPDELVRCPSWDWVTDVIVRKGSLDLLIHLGESPMPPLLRTLDIGRRTLEEAELEFLLEAGFWKGVPELIFRANTITATDAAALSYWPGLIGVRRLDLDGCPIGPEGAIFLSRSGYLDSVEELTVNPVYLDDESYWELQGKFGQRLRIT